MAAETFITQLLQLGVGGIDLKRAIDLISPLRLARMTNLARDEEGRARTRPGQRRFMWATGVRVHSLSRIQAALEGGEFVRLAGIDGALYAGREGPLSQIQDGFSGQPLTFVPGRPELSGDSWMLIGDSAKLVKVRASDRLVLPLGMRAPVSPVVASLGSDNQTLVDNFESATGWSGAAGTGGAPSQAFTTDGKVGGGCVAFTSNPGAAGAGYYNVWGKSLLIGGEERNLSILTGINGVVLASDSDQFHLWMKMDRPDLIQEVRIYVVVSASFSASVVPGTSALANTDAYVKSFIPSVFTPLVELAEAANLGVQTAIATREALEQQASSETDRDGNPAITTAEQQAETRALSERRLALGRAQWTEFGAIGTPLRRGEFLRIGSDTTRDWGTATGLIVLVKTTTNSAVVLQLDDFYLRGGYLPDTSEPTSVGYDWRYRHYDPRTGARSRWSPIMEDKLDVLRQSARLVPEAYGDPAVRQEFYRRGGTLPSAWNYVGNNHSDGGCGKDNVSDAQASAAGTNDDDDFHQPVSTVNRDGDPVYGQPIPILFGPLRGITFGIGDPYRPGHVYWSLPDQPDHWPLSNNAEVCSPDEELLNGCVFGGNAFVASGRAWYPLHVSVVDNRVQPASASCAKGLAARHSMVVGPDAIYFAATDGVWKTTGGTPQNLSDDFIEPLFRGTRKNGYAPIDWTAANQIRLAIHQNELWMIFQDVDGERQVWIYSLIFQFWRHYSFGWPIACVFSEEYGQPQLMLGSAATGRVYVHDSKHDDGLAITAALRSGAIHLGMPRQDKLFGDLELEMDLQGVNARVSSFANQEGLVVVQNQVIVPQLGPKVYVVDAFGTVPLLAKDVSFDISWSALGTSPWIGRGGPSFVPQPESAIGRITEWDNLGSPTNKIVKGILIEANTFGYLKQLQVMVDGGNTPVETFTLRTVGRQLEHISFSQQLDCRVVRLVPMDVSPWLPYDVRWIFDSDPLELVRWETQETDHGVLVDQTLGESWITIKSSCDVELTVTARRADGRASVSGTVVIPSTGGVKQKCYVKLPMLKGVLFKYLFVSQDPELPHRLYREESVVHVWPWGAPAPVPVQPFGTDALDIGRIVRDAEGAGMRGQRWLDTSAKVGRQ